MWDKENVERLRKLWLCGESAGQIAAKLNCSRSAVCAKLQRLGLRRAPKPPTSKPAILAARKAPFAVKRSAPIQRTRKRAAPKRAEYTRRQLYEMLAQAVKNTT
jgi:GcrA cell cycle regulator